MTKEDVGETVVTCRSTVCSYTVIEPKSSDD